MAAKYKLRSSVLSEEKEISKHRNLHNIEKDIVKMYNHLVNSGKRAFQNGKYLEAWTDYHKASQLNYNTKNAAFFGLEKTKNVINTMINENEKYSEKERKGRENDAKIRELQELLKVERNKREEERKEWKIFQEKAKQTEEDKVKLQQTLNQTEKKLDTHQKHLEQYQQQSKKNEELLATYVHYLSEKTKEIGELHQNLATLQEKNVTHIELQRKNQEILLEKEKIESQFEALQIQMKILEEEKVSRDKHQKDAEGLNQMRIQLLQHKWNVP